MRGILPKCFCEAGSEPNESGWGLAAVGSVGCTSDVVRFIDETDVDISGGFEGVERTGAESISIDKLGWDTGSAVTTALAVDSGTSLFMTCSCKACKTDEVRDMLAMRKAAILPQLQG
jgi:hypothetical protein